MLIDLHVASKARSTPDQVSGVPALEGTYETQWAQTPYKLPNTLSNQSRPEFILIPGSVDSYRQAIAGVVAGYPDENSDRVFVPRYGFPHNVLVERANGQLLFVSLPD